jgi:EmrB/QacA subfamily drug resistance transporter
VLAAVLGSSVVMLDATVVNVALLRMGADLDAGISGLQWVLTGYLVTLSALILLGGALGDRYGRRKIFIAGTIWFALASLLCAVAPNVPILVAARALQGIGGALLTPASLAIIQSSFRPDERMRAIGAWSGLGGVAAAVGPFLGGWLIDAFSWRAIFLLNLPVGLVVVAVAARHVPESLDVGRSGWHPDVAGGLFGALGLAGVTYALIEGPALGWNATRVLAAFAIGAAGFVAFVVVEARDPHAMLPLGIFRSRRFTGANLTTFVVYGALGGFFFLLAVELQSGMGYSPLEAGAAGLPVTLLMLAFSARSGALAQRIGPRIPMTIGPLVMAVGLVLARRIVPGAGYVDGVLPSIVLFSIGLVVTVAPLTATVLDAAPAEHAGVASGVNNAVARAASLVAIAVLPALAGIGGDIVPSVDRLADGFRTSSTIAAVLCAAGGVISWLTIGDEKPSAPASEEEFHCAVGAPPLRPSEPHWGCPERRVA